MKHARLAVALIALAIPLGGGAIQGGGAMAYGAWGGPRLLAAAGEDNSVPGFSRLHARASGASRLAGSITINSTTVAPDFQYDGSDASATWTSTTAGDTLALGGTGAAPVTGARAPFTDGTRAITGGADTGANAQSYRSTTAYGDTNAEDFVLEIVLRRCNPGANGVYASTSASGMGSEGWTILAESGSTTFSIHDGTSEVFDRSDADAPSTHGEWNIYHLFVDHGNITGAQLYRAGTIVSTSVNALIWGSIDGTTLTVGGALDSDTEGLDTECGVAWISQWSQSGWFDGTNNTANWAAFSRARTVGLMGIRFALANGTEIEPDTIDRESNVSCPVYDATDDSVLLFNLGDDLPCTSNAFADTAWGQHFGTRYHAILSYVGVTNLVADIQSSLAGWTNVASTDADDSATGPYGDSTAGEIAGDGVEGEHGLSTSETLTAARYTYSWFVTAGSQNWAYLDVSSIANVSAYFDLTSCEEGIVGSAATAETELYKDGICRISITYTGTAAAHTHRVLCAEADGDKSSAVDTTCLVADRVQIELSDVLTPFHEPTTARVALNIRWDPADVHPTAAGTFEAKLTQPARGQNNTLRYLWTVSDGSTNNRFESYLSANSYATQQVMFTGGVSSGGTPAGGGPGMVALHVPGEMRYMSGSWSEFYHSVGIDGGVGYQASGVLPPSSVTRVDLGGRASTTAPHAAVLEVNVYDNQRKRALASWGDSNTAATAWVGAGFDYPSIVGRASRSAFRSAFNGGASGETAAQIAARFVCANTPYGTATIMAGTNDFATIPTATTIAEIQGMLDDATACGQDVILMTTVPNDTVDTTFQSARATVNAWIRAQDGVGPVVGVVDVACITGTGTDCESWIPAYQYDTGHMNADGHAAVGAAILSELGW